MADARETERTTAKAGTEIRRTITGASEAAAMTPEGRLGGNFACFNWDKKHHAGP